MPAWYQKAAWKILRKTRGKQLLQSYNVSAEFLSPEPREPYILLANHAHVQDPWVIGALLSHTIRYMANLEGTHPFKVLFADIVGAYGKRKGAPDFLSLRNTLNLAKAGETLGIFPEGDRSWEGRPSPLLSGLGKLLRMLGMPVLLARQEGSYLSGPRWAALPRRGKWTVSFQSLSREQVLETPPGDLESKVRTFLDSDDMLNPALRNVRFECPAPAGGVERLLWLCPVCGAADKLSGSENRILCTACGSSWNVDGNQRIEPRNGRSISLDLQDLRGWTDLQKSALGKLVRGSEPIQLSDSWDPESVNPLAAGERLRDLNFGGAALVADGVELIQKTGQGPQTMGRGRLALFRDALAFQPADGAAGALFNVRKVLYFIDNFNVSSEFSYGRERYRVLFRGGNSMKWIQALAALNAPEGGTL